jgi:hypothetical protein
MWRDSATKTSSSCSQLSWPRIEAVDIIEDAKAVAILLREFDGTISAIRISADQLAD